MEFKEINAQTGWKFYAYNEEKQHLYLLAWLSKRIEIVENVDATSFKEFETAVGKHSKSKITLWVDKVQDKQGMKIESVTNELIKSFEYHVPVEYFDNMEWHVVKETVKLNNWKQLSKLSFFKRRKVLKQLLK